MKTGICIGFGIGLAVGVLLMNNCKKARDAVSDAQNAVTQKIEAKKREMAAQNASNEFAGDASDASDTPSDEMIAVESGTRRTKKAQAQ